MILAVASGKGGTGKTTIAVSLALAAVEEKEVLLADCDVEEPNVHILIKPNIEEKLSVTVPVPIIDEQKCSRCGICSETCRFNAVAVLHSGVVFFENLCHSCGACVLACPENALSEEKRFIGVMEKGNSSGIEYIGGRLNVGEARATPLIKFIKSHLNRVDSDIIIDVSPGTSCPVIEAVRGVDLILLVTEPTPFGLNDLKLSVETFKQLHIPYVVLVNRSDIGNGLDEWCASENIEVVMSIPFDRKIAEGYSKGIVPYLLSEEWRKRFVELWRRLKEKTGK